MASAVLIEGLSSALGKTRREIHELFETVEDEFSHLRSQLSDRLGSILARDRSNEEKADEITELGAGLLSNRETMKFALGIAGTIWGLNIAYVAAMATAGTVAVLGVSVPVILALLFGLLVMFVCGRYTLGMLREIFRRLEDASSQLGQI